MKPTITIPNFVAVLMDRLSDCGYEIFAVGGCVRDSLLGREPGDWDLCTSALPKETEAALKDFRLVETGLQHGTVTALSAGDAVEITTYRIDGAYSDCRRPDRVTFTPELREDLRRRDFTVNAMAYGKDMGLVDLFDGRKDLEGRLIRCVGTPDERFQEDALRILRALRFSSVLNFSIEAQTSLSLLKNKALLGHIAAERIFSELKKLLCGESASFVLQNYAPVFFEIIPELSALSPEKWQENSERAGRLPPSFPLRLASLLCGSEKEADSILRRLRADNATQKKVACLLELQKLSPPHTGADLMYLLKIYGAETVKEALPLWNSSLTENLLDAILKEKRCFSLKELNISGDDLLKLGARPGPELGKLLERLLEAAMAADVPNKKDSLQRLALQFMGPDADQN